MLTVVLAAVLLADCVQPVVAERDVLMKEAARVGVALTDDEVRSHSDVESAFSALGAEGAALREDYERELLADKMRRCVRRAIASRIPPITSEDVARERAAVTNHNATLEQSNRSICRLATNAWKSIRAGNDFETVGLKLKELCPSASYEPVCEDSETICTNVTESGLSAPLLSGYVLSFCQVSEATAGVRQVSRIVFRLQEPRAVLSEDETEAALVESAINAAYREWLAKRGHRRK